MPGCRRFMLIPFTVSNAHSAFSADPLKNLKRNEYDEANEEFGSCDNKITRMVLLRAEACYDDGQIFRNKGCSMGLIVLSGDELVSILAANARMPDQVMGMETEGQEIKVQVASPVPLLRSIPVRIKFAGFEQGRIVLQLVTNRVIDQFEWLVNKMLASLNVEDYGGRWEYPRLYVDVNHLLQRQVRGIEIAGVVFQDGQFHITTSHSGNGLGGGPRNAAPSGQTARQ